MSRLNTCVPTNSTTMAPDDLNSHAYRPDLTLQENYNFQSDYVGLRLHRIWVYQHEALELPDAKFLIDEFEERHRRVRSRDRWETSTTRYRRLTGFDMQFAFSSGGIIRFLVNSPEIPFFGRLVSRHFEDSPVVYSSIEGDGGPTPCRYFLNGRDFARNGLPTGYQEQFAAMEAAESGFAPNSSALEEFFPIPRR